MPAVRVVRAFDPFEQRPARLRLGLEPTPVEHFTFQDGEEALVHGIVVVVAGRTHRRHHTHLPAVFTERTAGVLDTAVGMMDYLLGLVLPQSHVQLTEDQLGSYMVDLLHRLDLTLDKALTKEIFTDEINA